MGLRHAGNDRSRLLSSRVPASEAIASASARRPFFPVRHHAGAQFAHQPSPRLRIFSNVIGIERGERESPAQSVVL